MTEITDVVNVTINVADTRISREGFGTILVFDTVADSVFSERTKSYPNIAAVVTDFAATTKVHKASTAVFSQTRTPTSIKVGRHESGDASLTTALAAILAEDSDFYAVASAKKASSDIQLIAAWCEANGKIFIGQSSDADVLTAVDTDIASLLQASSYNKTAYMWHHQVVQDRTGVVAVVASGIATITQALHGLRIGDPVTFDNSATVAIDGDNVVATIPTDGTYTVTTTAGDATGTVDFFSGYNFPEAAWLGYMLPSDPGSETWKFKTLAGIQITSKTHLSPSQEAVALGKNANLYTYLAGVGHTQEGTMASGRYIDIERGSDWIEARIEEAIATRLLNTPKIPYSDAGASIFNAEMSSVFDLGVTRGVMSELLDDSGDFYRIFIPKVADQLTADRQARYFPGITAEIQYAGAVHKTVITVNATI
jgi:hypothetical protein